MIYNFSEHLSIFNRYIADLRSIDIQKDRMRFRRNLERVGEIMAYEISKQLEYKSEDIETPLGIAKMNILEKQPVLATILRAGLPFHQGFLNVFDEADNAFISAYRKHHKDGTFEIRTEYMACPDIENRPLIIVDPMLATGASMVVALNCLKEHGTPSKIHIATTIAAVNGVEYVQRNYPDANIWAGAIDEELTAKSYIVPGLGDAGDLAYGSKKQR